MRANDFTCTKGPKGPIGSWDVSRVTDPNRLFAHNSILDGEYYTNKFNGDISKWDVSRVTNMEALFNNARAFNGDISKWDVSNVENFHAVFGHTPSFSQVLCGEWKKNPKSNNAYNDNGRWFENSSGKLC